MPPGRGLVSGVPDGYGPGISASAAGAAMSGPAGCQDVRGPGPSVPAGGVGRARPPTAVGAHAALRVGEREPKIGEIPGLGPAPTAPPVKEGVMASDCLFCGIAAGEIQADIVHEDDELVAFRDIHPQGPVHILVIPRRHLASLEETRREHAELLGRLLLAAAELARREGIADSGYRAVLNVGDDGGQTVDHLHVHLVGGRRMGWPPG